MRKSYAVISSLLLFHLLAVPTFSVFAAEAEAIRAQVIDSELAQAFDDEGGSTKQSVMVYIEDIEHPEPIARTLAASEQSAALSLQSTDSEEGSSQEEIAAVQELIMKQRAESRKRYIAQNTAFAEKNIDAEDIVYISRYSPVILTSLNETEVNQLAIKDGVTEINLYAPSNAAEVDAVVEEEVVAPLAESASVDPTASITTLIDRINAETVTSQFTGS